VTDRLVVLSCHRVGVPPAAARYRRMFTSPGLLAFQIRVLRFAGYRISTLRDAIDTRGRRAVVTFDDGARDNLSSGLPTCAAHGVPATVFVVSADVGREAVTWPESGDPLPDGSGYRGASGHPRQPRGCARVVFVSVRGCNRVG
jgi:peptidoglycan/xylan/chitin deacetylase (PgdA/CDA1 family)